LNANDVIDEGGLVEQLAIDLNANIFDFDLNLMEKQLLRIPAIRSARIERVLPGTLSFHVSTRKPRAWITTRDQNVSTTRKLGQLLVDSENYIYPCPEQQLDEAMNLPVIQVQPDSAHPITADATMKHPEYRRCIHLLDSFLSVFPNDLRIIETVYQTKPWSITMSTRSGTVATFGLDDHVRQLDYLSQSLRHAQKKGYEIETINLIPKQNIPITIRGEDAPPRAIPVGETPSTNNRGSRQNNDLQSLLNRN
jgi:hypothetical protein